MRYKSTMAIVLMISVVGLFSACQKIESPANDEKQKMNDLPAVEIYPTGKVVERAYGEDGSFQIRMVTSADHDNILLFYEKSLPRNGWRKVVENNRDQYLAIYQRSNETIHLSLFPTDSDNQIMHVFHYSRE